MFNSSNNTYVVGVDSMDAFPNVSANQQTQGSVLSAYASYMLGHTTVGQLATSSSGLAWSAPVILGSVILTLFFLERVVFYQLIAKFLPQLKQTTTILRSSSTAMSSLHSSLSFSSAFYMLFASELYPWLGGSGSMFVDYYLLPQYRLHMLCEFGWYLFDTLSEVSQMVFPPKENTATVATNNKAEGVEEPAPMAPPNSGSDKKQKEKESSGGAGGLLQAGFLLHHAPPLFGLYVYYFHSHQLPVPTQRVCAFIIIRMSMWHFTTPLQNLRWFMDKLQLGEGFLSSTPSVVANGTISSVASVTKRYRFLIGLIYQLNFATFLVAFFTIRIYGIIPLVRSVAWLYDMPSTTTLFEIVRTLMPIKCLFFTGTLYLLSAYWFYLNARRAFRVFFPKPSALKSAI